jgi:hypothetical protein
MGGNFGVRLPGLGLLALILAVFVAVSLSPVPTRAQSAEEYERWLEWCYSIGGTPNGDASNPVCTPGAQPPCCEPPPPPDYSYLAPYYNTLNTILDELRPYSAVAAGFGSQGLADEATLSAAMKAIYDPLYVEYLKVDDLAQLYRQQVDFFNQQMESQRFDVTALESRLGWAQLRMSELEAETQRLNGFIAETRAISWPLRDRALALINNSAADSQLVSLMLLYSPDTALTSAALNGKPAQLELPGWQYEDMPGQFVAAFAHSSPPAAPWPQQAPGGRTIFVLDQSSPIDTQLGALGSLKQWRIQAALDYSTYAADAERLRSSFEPLWQRKNDLTNQVSDADIAMINLENTARALRANHDAALVNKETAAKALAREMVVSLAKDMAADKMKDTVGNLLSANGLPGELPGMSSDDLVAAAKSGIRHAIPAYGFQEQWEAFVEIQKQSLDLLGRTEGYILEAAKLSAEASPERMSGLMERVFADVNWQGAEFVRQVGFSDLPETEKSIFESFLDKYLDSRKPQEAQ